MVMDSSTPGPTDAELIAGSDEHPERFGGVFDRHFAAIHRYLLRRAGRQTADDLAVETFTVAFSRRHTYHPRPR
jgi:DNA-directed RNA polymerase specialized sigma24 family protein